MEVYTITKHLGHGTYGNVFLCNKIHNGQRVVMKQIQCDLTKTDTLKQAKNEAKILKVLKHPNIIQYYDSYLKGNMYHIIMEYALKGTLYEHIGTNKPCSLDKEWVLSAFCQLLLGVDVIHSKNIIHRDLKSENIFLSGTNSDIIKIGDFGISQTLQNDGQAKTTIGTTNYLAPEVCDGKPYGMPSDIWSLGCVLYEMCAMERLFDGPMSKIIEDIKIGKTKAIDQVKYGYGVQEIIEMMIQVDPDQRPKTKQLLAHSDIFPVRAYLMVNLGKLEKM